ncbi:uncharacterized protein C2845_PM05G32450 [Panicum miliaceum]|uniref:At1g61320/AtMIF1 LRR domain-containing protein n=1 Tax=Panicum miliaceum TaxID=4540 RepID=A0A3L6SYY3_PANMI|nr:uncharacterized protein C2845_PM05G32450 [Panicum miliaceum]
MVGGRGWGCRLRVGRGREYALELASCNEIICLKIPCMLEQFSCLTVSGCSMLQIIESKAPNLSTIIFEGNLVQLSLGQPLNVTSLDMQCSDETNFLCYAITKLPYVVPNLETLSLSSDSEMVPTPMVASKFVHLKHLQICLGGCLSEGYDFLSLVSFLDASPVLEAFVLGVYQSEMNFDSVFGNTTHMRQMPEHKHHSLKDLMIFGFCSARSMVELTCHILESATNIESVTLDCVFDEYDEENTGRCSVTYDRKPGDCFPLNNEMILEANKGIMAIDRYIASKVPSAAKLDVRGHCSRCHSIF